MKVAFINTPGAQNADPFRMTPIGSLLLLTILRQQFNGQLELSFTDLRGLSEDEAICRLTEQDVFLHYCTSQDWPALQRLMAKLRDMYPRALHLAGGPHCNIFPAETEALFDSICIGEGEQVIGQMIADARQRILQKRYMQRFRTDITDNPIADRHYLPTETIAVPGLLSRHRKTLKTAAVLFSRGCPFACRFCANQYRQQIQYRTAQQIVEEIEYLKRDYGVEAVALKDDNGIPVNAVIAETNMKAIGKTGVLWRAQGRANGIPSSVVHLAADNGCAEITAAVESAWQPSLDAINKTISVDRAIPYCDAIRNAGLELKILLILGLPMEPENIAALTIDFIERVQPTTVVLSLLCPMPGSEIWRNPAIVHMRLRKDIPFNQLMSVWGRFDEKETPPQMFDYEDGYGQPWLATKENYLRVQAYLRQHDLNH